MGILNGHIVTGMCHISSQFDSGANGLKGIIMFFHSLLLLCFKMIRQRRPDVLALPRQPFFFLRPYFRVSTIFTAMLKGLFFPPAIKQLPP